MTPINSKYTFIYNEKIEALLNSILSSIVADLSDFKFANYIEFLVLGGGYGRGEGGILFDENKNPNLYNDLDFFVISNTKDTNINSKINSFFCELSKKYTKKIGIDVDFSRAFHSKYIQKKLDVLMWREMVLGANILWGDSQKFRNLFKVNESDLPEAKEVEKLLFNRLSGLFFAFQRLQLDSLNSDDFNFISRNINKSILAIADARLIASKCYPFKSVQRLAALKNLLSKDDELLIAYQKALLFKQFPNPVSDKKIAMQMWQNTANLALKNIELLSDFFKNDKKYRPIELLKNLLKNLKLRKIFKNLKKSQNIFSYPISNAMPILSEIIQNPYKISQNGAKIYKEIWEQLN